MSNLTSLDSLSRPTGRCKQIGCKAPAVVFRLDAVGRKGGCCKVCARLGSDVREFRKR